MLTGVGAKIADHGVLCFEGLPRQFGQDQQVAVFEPNC